MGIRVLLAIAMDAFSFMSGLCALIRLLNKRKKLVRYLCRAHGRGGIVIWWHLSRCHIRHWLRHSMGHGRAAALLWRRAIGVRLTTVATEVGRHSISPLTILLVTVIVVCRVSHLRVESSTVCPTAARATGEVAAVHVSGLMSSMITDVANI